jgi:hypothetical protein
MATGRMRVERDRRPESLRSLDAQQSPRGERTCRASCCLHPTMSLTSSGCRPCPQPAVVWSAVPPARASVTGRVYGCDVERNLLTGREVANRTVQPEACALSRRGSKTRICSSSSWTTALPGCLDSARACGSFRNRSGLRCELLVGR